MSGLPKGTGAYLMQLQIDKEKAQKAQVEAQYPPRRYQHDCTACVYLGHFEEYDLYVCPQGGIPTVIARFSSEGPDYQSGLDAGKSGLLPFLAEAYSRAVSNGLLP